MQDCDDVDRICCFSEKNAEREHSDNGSPETFVYDWEGTRTFLNAVEYGVDFIREVSSQA